MEKYNLIGQNYNATRKADPFIASRILDLLQCEKDDKLLDIGCGTGNYTIALSESELNICGIEPSGLMLNEAKSKNPEISWTIGNAEKLPFENDNFDFAIATLTIHHWKDLEKGFSEIRRILKPSGKFLIFTSTSEQMENYWLNHYFPKMMEKSIEQMPKFNFIKENLEKTGFKIAITEKYSIKDDLQDKFLYIGKNNPEIYLNENVRKGISSFANLAHRTEIEIGLKNLKNEIENNNFQKIKNKFNNENGDYLFIVANKHNV